MMPAASISTVTIARAAQLVGFAVVAVALAVVSWSDTSLNLPDVGQFAGIIGSGFLGGIINPLMKSLTGEEIGVVLGSTAGMTRGVEVEQERAAAALRTKSDLMWEIAVVIGAIAIVVAALALAIDGHRHMNAAPALTAMATAFGALFLDTSKVLHTPPPVPAVVPVPAPIPVPVPVPAPIPNPSPAPSQTTGSAPSRASGTEAGHVEAGHADPGQDA